MKHDARIIVLILALLWSLAWSAAGRAVRTDEPPEEPAPAAARPTESGGADGKTMLRILHGGEVEEMPMDAYLLGVLRAEMPASFEPEALKAQAIAARTYTLCRMRSGIPNHPDADACDDVNCCKAFLDAAKAAANWGEMALYNEEKLERAVRETDGKILVYDGEPILAVFFSSAGGYTQNAGVVWQQDLPYLRSVPSPETEAMVPDYYSTTRIPAEEFRARILAAYPEAALDGELGGWIGAVVRNDAGYVTELSVGGVRIRGNELRTLLGLRSPSFTIEAEEDALVFHVTGYGHGVGMSQYGANALALQGMCAEEILEHYFTGARMADAIP